MEKYYFDINSGEEVTKEQYDIFSKMYQDVAGTIPADKDGDPVARIDLDPLLFPDSESSFHLVPQNTPQETLKMQVEKLTPKDGDTIVLKLSILSTDNDLENALDELDKLMTKMDVDVHAIVIREDENLECLSEEKMAKRGWVRKREYKGREFL